MNRLVGLLLCCASLRAGAQDSVRVWANTASGVYHCAGSEYYGKTSVGAYMTERAAVARGFHGVGGKTCGGVPRPAPAPVAAPLSAAALDSGPQRPRGQTTECIVAKVVDGDTIECRGGIRVRLVGIDAPELNQVPFGTTSARELAALLPIGANARVEPDVQPHDQYGRLLAYVWVNNTQINWTMIRAGWVVLLSYPPNIRYVDYFSAAQRQARDEKRGLWKTNGFACLPSDRRQRRC